MKRLCLCIHNHQPVGNFDHVFLEAINRSYLPFLQTLLDYPRVRISLHTSGPLLEFIEQHHIDAYLDTVRTLVNRGQVELVGGGYYEPVLQLLPERDRVEQIQLMSKELERLFGVRPTGLWMTERVWEPQLARSLALAGARWTLLDDNGFEKAGVSGSDLFHTYVTEEENYPVVLLPILKELRYMIPWSEPEETLNYVRASLDDAELFVYGDDGEKFGLWPGTYDHVYTDGWLRRFLGALSNADDIETITAGEAVQLFHPADRIYLPACSYEEMEEWSLAATRQHMYRDLRASVGPNERPFVTGGTFRNYLARYDEANRMQKRMLFVGRELGNATGEARTHYLRSQCNCAYWHGIFGGLYLPHLRDAVYAELLTAERLLRDRREGIWFEDVDGDGRSETVLTDSDQTVFLRSRGGCLAQWDSLPQQWSWTNVMTRYHEAYHDKMKSASAAQGEFGKAANIHESLRVKDTDALEALQFDDYTRLSFLDHFCLTPETAAVTTPDTTHYEASISQTGARFDKPGVISKTFALTEDGMRVDLQIDAPGDWYVCELNLAVWWEDRERSFTSDSFSLGTPEHCISLQTSFPVRVDLSQIRTVSNSESGIETIYQGMQVMLGLDLKQTRHLTIDLRS